jgi:hypothetical protein
MTTTSTNLGETSLPRSGPVREYAEGEQQLVAGEDLTREGLVDALEEVGSSLEGPNLAPYRYSEDSHLGISGMELVELQDGKGEPLTKVLTTDIGDAEITEDDSGQADDAPPADGIPDVDSVG